MEPCASARPLVKQSFLHRLASGRVLAMRLRYYCEKGRVRVMNSREKRRITGALFSSFFGFFPSLLTHTEHRCSRLTRSLEHLSSRRSVREIQVPEWYAARMRSLVSGNWFDRRSYNRLFIAFSIPSASLLALIAKYRARSCFFAATVFIISFLLTLFLPQYTLALWKI